MVLYTCFRCGYETKHKCNFITHVNRKNICPPHLCNMEIEIIKKYYNLFSNPKKFIITPSKPSKNKNICQYCQQEFTRADNLKRHYNRCKVKATYNLTNVDVQIIKTNI